MQLALVYPWTLLVTSLLTLPMYAVTFAKVWFGSRFKLVLVLIAFLFTANIGYFVGGIGQLELVKQQVPNE